MSDERGTLEDYCFALSDFSNDAVWNTVNNLRRGVIEEASKDFCPKAPKLAEFVRSEQARLDAVGRLPTLPAPAITKEFKRWDIIQRREANELAGSGFRLLAEKIGLDEMNIRAKRREFPEGTIWFWCLQEAWGPPSGVRKS